ncbi:hypothetical protein V5799_004417 [Amblyomma americanum]|uniref:Uncharacterized protein n=1 Tax=Amblyomma americanum TaxID=6943 RepID=A0AAQ4D663_AMBAM
MTAVRFLSLSLSFSCQSSSSNYDSAEWPVDRRSSRVDWTWTASTDLNAPRLGAAPQTELKSETLLSPLASEVIRSCEIMDRAKKGRLTRCQSNSRNGRISDKEAELKAYGELVDKKLVEAEELGSRGKVQEALAVIRDVERLKRRRTRIEMYLDRRPNEPVKEQKQNICEECQLCIGLDDNEQRIANHSSGRLHNALLDMRRKISELANNLEKAQVPGDWARFEGSQLFPEVFVVSRAARPKPQQKPQSQKVVQLGLLQQLLLITVSVGHATGRAPDLAGIQIAGPGPARGRGASRVQGLRAGHARGPQVAATAIATPAAGLTAGLTLGLAATRLAAHTAVGLTAGRGRVVVPADVRHGPEAART